MATVVFRYVDTDIAVAGDGRTWATAAPTLEGMLSLISSEFNGSLVTAGVRVYVLCRGSATDTQNCDTSVISLTTNAECYIHAIGNWFGPAWDASAYRLVTTSYALFITYQGIRFLRFSGLQMGSTNTANNNRNIVDVFGTTSTDYRFHNCIISMGTMSATTTGCVGMRLRGSGTKRYVSNLIVTGVKSDWKGMDVQGGGSSTARNITVITESASAIGVSVTASSTDFVASNVGVAGPGIGWFKDATSAEVIGSHNASQDATALGTSPRLNVTPTFANAASGDYRLDPTDTAWRGLGVDMSADATVPVTVALNGGTLGSGSSWDIGAMTTGTAVVADRAEVIGQPEASYYVGDQLLVVAQAVQGAGGPQQVTRNGGTTTLCWSDDTGTALATGTWQDGYTTFVRTLTAQDIGSGRTLVVQSDDGLATSAPSTATTVQTMVVADRIEWQTQPLASYDVGDGMTVAVKAVQGDSGPTQDNLSTGSATLYWSDDLVTPLVSASWVNGVATLSYTFKESDVGAGRTLVATGTNGSTSLTETPSSTALDVVAAVVATKLAFAVAPPTSIAATQSFDCTVTVVNDAGLVDDGETGTVTLTTDLGTLGGVTAVAASSGVAEFNGLTLDTAGTATLTATYSVNGITSVSATVTVTGANPATTVAVTVQPPASVTATTAFGLTVEMQDDGGALDTSFSGTAVVTGGEKLTGTTSVPFLNGTATFSGLTLQAWPQTGVVLTVAVAGLVSGTTSPMDVTVPVTGGGAGTGIIITEGIMDYELQVGDPAPLLELLLLDATTGQPLTGLLYNTVGLSISYRAVGSRSAATSVTLANLSSYTTTYVSGGFIEDPTRAGVYRFDPPLAMVGSESTLTLIVSAPDLMTQFRRVFVVPDKASALLEVGGAVLVTPSQRLVTDASGQVGTNNVPIDQLLESDGAGGQRFTSSALSQAPSTSVAPEVAADIAAAILVDPANKLVTNAAGQVETSNVSGAVPTASEVATQVRTELGTELARIDATVSSRAATGDAMTLTTAERTSLTASVWSYLTSGIATAGSIGKQIVDNLNAAITSRLDSASYVAPNNAAITDALTAASAAQTAAESVDAKITTTRLARIDGAAQSTELVQAGGLTSEQASQLATAASASTSTDGKLTTTRLARIDGAAQSDELIASVGALSPEQSSQLATAAAEAQVAATKAASADAKLTNSRLTNLDNVAQVSDLSNIQAGLSSEQSAQLTTAATQATAAATDIAATKAVADAVDAKLSTDRLARIDTVALVTDLPDAPDNAGIAAARAAAEASQVASENVDGKLTLTRMAKLDGAAQSAELPVAPDNAGIATAASAATAARAASESVDGKLTADIATRLATVARVSDLPESPDNTAILAARDAALAAQATSESVDGKLTADIATRLATVARVSDLPAAPDNAGIATASAAAVAAQTAAESVDAKITTDRLAKLDGAAQSAELPATVGGLTPEQITTLTETREWAERAAKEAAEGGEVVSVTPTETVVRPRLMDGTAVGGTRKIKRNTAGVEIEVTELTPES